MRKQKSKSNLNAQSILEPGFINELINNDQGYSILRSIRGSPPYWQIKQKELICMIRQLGLPTLFFTLSAAETKWPELLVLLTRVVHKKIITLEGASNLSFEEKSLLIRKEPVICAKYFQHRLNSLLKGVIFKKNGPFEEHNVEDYYYRVEFQHRGY